MASRICFLPPRARVRANPDENFFRNRELPPWRGFDRAGPGSGREQASEFHQRPPPGLQPLDFFQPLAVLGCVDRVAPCL